MTYRESKPKVVFIVSQPRAGSTLLQTMLGGHPRVLALGETRIMLPLAQAIPGNTSEVDSPHDGYSADHATRVFVQEHLDGGIGVLQEEVGEAASRIYQRACQQADADVLIDKTMRYYWIIEDLLRMMPDSRIIVLLRNPMAVLSSVIQTSSTSDSSSSLYSFRADLLEAPARLANAIQTADDRLHVVHYEQLVIETEPVLAGLQSFMGMEVVENVPKCDDAKPPHLGDQTGIQNVTSVHQRSLEKWVRHAAQSAFCWRLLDDYRQHLGSDLISRLGYDTKSIEDKLFDVRPPGTAIAPSLSTFVNKKPSEPIRSIMLLRKLAAKAVSRVARSAA